MTEAKVAIIGHGTPKAENYHSLDEWEANVAEFKAHLPQTDSAAPDLVTAKLDVAAIWRKRNAVGGGVQRVVAKADD